MFIRVCPSDPGPSPCPNPVWMQYADIQTFQVSSLDPGTLAVAFGSGFSIVATAFCLGYAASMLLKAFN